jgi:hypothetical protein
MNKFLTPTYDARGAIHLGFRFGAVGTHSSRTIMLSELESLFASRPQSATRADYAAAIIQENCLGKETGATRRLTNQRLTELYALDPEVQLFRILRHLWSLDPESRPLLALLIALARDPLLLATAEVILNMPIGTELPRMSMKQALVDHVGERMNDASVDKIVRNVSSSWTQSGHLSGRTFKIRRKVNATATAIALALLLARTAGFDGPQLFANPWISVLDCPPSKAHDLALEAKKQGLLDLRVGGDVVEIDFTRLDPKLVERRWAV